MLDAIVFAKASNAPALACGPALGSCNVSCTLINFALSVSKVSAVFLLTSLNSLASSVPNPNAFPTIETSGAKIAIAIIIGPSAAINLLKAAAASVAAPLTSTRPPCTDKRDVPKSLFAAAAALV